MFDGACRNTPMRTPAGMLLAVLAVVLLPAAGQAQGRSARQPALSAAAAPAVLRFSPARRAARVRPAPAVARAAAPQSPRALSICVVRLPAVTVSPAPCLALFLRPQASLGRLAWPAAMPRLAAAPNTPPAVALIGLRRLRPAAASLRLSVPAAVRPRVTWNLAAAALEPAAVALDALVLNAPAAPVVTAAGVPDLPTDPLPVARLADGPAASAAEPPADDTRSVALLLGAKPVLAAVRSIPGLPDAPEEAPTTPIPVKLMEGKSRILPAQGLRTLQIDDPTGAIAEVQPISETEVLLLAKGPGTTTVRVWDQRGRTEYELTVDPSPARQQQMIQEAIGIQGVKVRVVGNVALLEGEVTSLDQVARAQRIAEAFVAKVVNELHVPPPPPAAPAGPSLAEQVQALLPPGEVKAESLPGQPNVVVLRGLAPRPEDLTGYETLAEKVVPPGKGTVVNLIRLAQPRQVRVQARMVNVDEHLLNELGVHWNEDATWGQTAAGTGFRLGTAIQADIKAVISSDRTEVLASPSVVVNSGANGTIQIGGDVPIPTVVTGFTGTAGANQPGNVQQPAAAGVGTIGQSVFFRQFGVLLNIEPVVTTDNEVTMRLLAEVSAIDRNSSVTVAGAQIPGFTTKRALTELRLKAGETLVIGGLISRDEAKSVYKFPLLGDIPIFGQFFRSVRKEKQTRELVLFLTPDLLPGPPPPAGLGQTPDLKPSSLEDLLKAYVGLSTNQSSPTAGGQAGTGMQSLGGGTR